MLRKILLFALIFVVRVRSENSQLDDDYSDFFGVFGDRIATKTTAKAPAEVPEEDFEEFSGIDVNFMPKRNFDFSKFQPNRIALGAKNVCQATCATPMAS